MRKKLYLVLLTASIGALFSPSTPIHGVEAVQKPAEKPKVLEILSLAKETSKLISDPEVDKDLIAREIAETQARAGDIKAALSTVLKSRSYHAILLSRVAAAQAKSGDYHAAFRTADSIESPEEKINALNGIAQAHAHEKHYDDAQSAFNEALEEVEPLKDDSEKTRLLKKIAEAQVAVGYWTSAFITVKFIPNLEDKTEILSNMARQQVEAGNLRMAMNILDDVEDEKIRNPILESIATAQAKRDDIKHAKETVDWITNKFYKAKALAAVAEAQVREGSQTDAQATFQIAKKTARQMTEDFYNKTLLLVSIAEAEFLAGEKNASTESYQEAKRAAMEIPIEKNYGRAMALNELGESLARAGDTTASEEAFQEAKKAAAGFGEATFYRTTVVMSIAQGELAVGNKKAALGILEEALKIAMEVPSDAQKTNLLLEIAVLQTQAGDQQSSLQTLQKAQRIATQIKDDMAKLAVSVNIAVTNIRLGYIKAALQFADESGRDVHEAEILSRITQEQTQAGDFEDALETAMEQRSALHKTKALLGVANGLLDVQDRQKQRKSVLSTDEDEGEEDEEESS